MLHTRYRSEEVLRFYMKGTNSFYNKLLLWLRRKIMYWSNLVYYLKNNFDEYSSQTERTENINWVAALYFSLMNTLSRYIRASTSVKGVRLYLPRFCVFFSGWENLHNWICLNFILIVFLVSVVEECYHVQAHRVKYIRLKISEPLVTKLETGHYCVIYNCFLLLIKNYMTAHHG